MQFLKDLIKGDYQLYFIWEKIYFHSYVCCLKHLGKVCECERCQVNPIKHLLLQVNELQQIK